MSALDVFCLAMSAAVLVTITVDIVRARRRLARILAEPFAEQRDVTGRLDRW